MLIAGTTEKLMSEHKRELRMFWIKITAAILLIGTGSLFILAIVLCSATIHAAQCAGSRWLMDSAVVQVLGYEWIASAWLTLLVGAAMYALSKMLRL